MSSSQHYRIKEIFYTLQGEGAQAGRPSVFCRFSKCNLWNGREADRAEAVCQFCDTDFIGTDGQNGGIYTADQIVDIVSRLWPDLNAGTPYIVCTGGEPLLQLDDNLIQALHQTGFTIAIETNGTLPVPDGIDWVCLSPKGASDIVVSECHELKLVYPQPEALPERFDDIRAEHRYLQPMDTSALAAAGLISTDRSPAKHSSADQTSADHTSADTTRQTLHYCLKHPQWKLSLQTHKWLGID